MYDAVILALVLWAGVSVLLFAVARPASALGWSFVIAILFLPHGGIDFAGLPGFGKIQAAGLGSLLGTIIFAPTTLARFRVCWIDVLALAAPGMCALSSRANDLGSYDAMSAFVGSFLDLSLPYFLARVHLQAVDDLLRFVKLLFWCSLVYVAIAVWEFRMSPQLHNTVYGYHPHVWGGMARWGFYRPRGFFRHPLDLAYFFAFCGILGASLASCRALTVAKRPQGWLVGGPLLGLALSMSAGPWFAGALGLLLVRFRRRRRWLVYLPFASAVLWSVSLFGGYTTGSWAHDLVGSVSQERAGSLEYRIAAQQQYRAAVVESPWFGHGRWGRGRIERVATDGVVLVFLINYGAMGLGALLLWLAAMIWCGTRMSSGSNVQNALCFGCAASLSVLTLTSTMAWPPLHLMVLCGGGLVTVKTRGDSEAVERRAGRYA